LRRLFEEQGGTDWRGLYRIESGKDEEGGPWITLGKKERFKDGYKLGTALYLF